MTKQDIIKALEVFSDDETISLEEYDGGLITYEYQLKPAAVCGGEQAVMPYFCVRKKGHAGPCYCSCKNMEFKKESPEEIAAFFEQNN